MGYVDTKEFAKAMREQRVRDSNGNIICSNELWELIAQIFESLPGADVVEVVRCKDCIHSEELAKHCEIDRKHYRHCKLWRGEETKNVWHKYTKHHKDYSIVSVDGFCDDGCSK